MKNLKFSLLLAISCCAPMFTSCSSYRHHLPQVAVSDTDADPLVMKVGERRKIMSKTFLSVISPGHMPSPSLYHVISSNPKVMTISGGQSDDAWAEAKSTGRADILYQYESGKMTPIRVIPATGVSGGEKKPRTSP